MRVKRLSEREYKEKLREKKRKGRQRAARGERSLLDVAGGDHREPPVGEDRSRIYRVGAGALVLSIKDYL